MGYVANVTKTDSVYLLLWSVRNASLIAGPGLPKSFSSFADLISYLCTRTTFSRPYQATLRQKLDKEGSHFMELDVSPEEIDEWRALTSTK
jgi:hypothetical protein